MDVRKQNRQAWNHWVEQGDRWTVPVDEAAIARARNGDWAVLLTNNKPVPREWFPDLDGLDVLCLASGGGQQGPIFAATGANVTVYDNSPNQLARDKQVAERDGLNITTVEGDMRDLGVFPDASFDLIFQPFSNNFVPDVNPVWYEAFRVLRPGGCMMTGFMNPFIYIFDLDLEEREKKLELRYSLPFSDIESRDPSEHQQLIDKHHVFEFSHSLEDQIGGQLRAGFLLSDLYEDRHAVDEFSLAQYGPTLIATRAVKP